MVNITKTCYNKRRFNSTSHVEIFFLKIPTHVNFHYNYHLFTYLSDFDILILSLFLYSAISFLYFPNARFLFCSSCNLFCNVLISLFNFSASSFRLSSFIFNDFLSSSAAYNFSPNSIFYSLNSFKTRISFINSFSPSSDYSNQLINNVF